MKKSKQLSFFSDGPKFPSGSKAQNQFFGGELLAGKRRARRPNATKNAIHLVLRSEWACGSRSFLQKRNQSVIDSIIQKFAKKFKVRIYQRAINSNHIHLLLKISNRELYRAFVKAIAGMIASHVMNQKSFTEFIKTLKIQKRGDGSAGDGSTCAESASVGAVKLGFWQFRPFSRVVNWGRDYNTCVNYVKQNVLEALGFVSYSKRKNRYSKWLQSRSSQNDTGVVKFSAH